MVKIGDRVKLAQNPHESRTFVVESSEEHNGLTFYRVKGLIGALFLASSLKVVG
jgi:hypothetical protein